MNQNVRRKLEIIEEKSKSDLTYRKMMEEYKQYEKAFTLICKDLNDEQRAAVWDYVMICEDMSRRLLERACEI